MFQPDSAGTSGGPGGMAPPIEKADPQTRIQARFQDYVADSDRTNASIGVDIQEICFHFNHLFIYLLGKFSLFMNDIILRFDLWGELRPLAGV